MPYISTLCNIANHFNLAMKFANPVWNDDICGWYRDFPKWLPRSNNRKLSGFLVYNYLKKWNGGRLLLSPVSHSLRAEFLLDMLKSLENECPDIFPREVEELLQRDITYL